MGKFPHLVRSQNPRAPAGRCRLRSVKCGTGDTVSPVPHLTVWTKDRAFRWVRRGSLLHEKFCGSASVSQESDQASLGQRPGGAVKGVVFGLAVTGRQQFHEVE